MDEIVKAVLAYAKANYSKGGWDRIVECYDASDVADLVAGCTSASEAITKVAGVIGASADVDLDRMRQADAEAVLGGGAPFWGA